MKTSSSRTVYGLFEITRHVARRVRREWEAVENPPRPPMRLTPESVAVLPVSRCTADRRRLAA